MARRGAPVRGAPRPPGAAPRLRARGEARSGVRERRAGGRHGGRPRAQLLRRRLADRRSGQLRVVLPAPAPPRLPRLDAVHAGLERHLVMAAPPRPGLHVGDRLPGGRVAAPADRRVRRAGGGVRGRHEHAGAGRRPPQARAAAGRGRALRRRRRTLLEPDGRAHRPRRADHRAGARAGAAGGRRRQLAGVGRLPGVGDRRPSHARRRRPRSAHAGRRSPPSRAAWPTSGG